LGDNLSVSLDTSKDVPQTSLEEEAAKYDEPQTEETNEASDAGEEERPEWLPEKFKSVEDLAKAYSELEKKMGSQNKEEPTPTEEAKTEETVQEADDAAEKAVEDAGLDLQVLSQKFWDKGELDAEDYTALETKGIPKALVDEYIALKTSQFENTVMSTVGGRDAYTEMISWASDNLSQSEIDAYNRAVNSGDINMANMATKGLQARFKAEAGFEPSRSVKGENVSATADVYRSLAELQKDMSDPRYQKDPAFRRDVERKLERSDIM